MKYIALTIHGHYVRCGPGDGVLAKVAGVWADGTGLGDESIFERIEVAPGQVVLHPLSGGYLQARPDDMMAVNPDGFEVWETFTEIEWPDGRFSLKTWRDKYVCAQNGGGSGVVADRTTAGEWERFYYEVPPAGFLPAEPPAKPEKGPSETITGARKLPGENRPNRAGQKRDRFK